MAGPVNASYSSRGRSGRRYGDVATSSLAVAVATLGVWAVLGPESWGLGLLLLALATAGVAGRLYVQRRRQRGLLGSELAARSIIVAGVAVAGRVDEPGGNPVGVGLAAAILIGAAAAEVFLRRAARYNPPVIAHLPGIAPQRPARNPSVLIVSVSLAATLLGLLIVAVGASAWWWVALAVLTLGPPAWLTVASRGRVLQARRLRTTVPRALADYAPEFVVYTSRPDDASYQVAMWLPYLQRAGKRFVIITRNTIPAAALAQLTDVPVIEARSISDLDALVPPSLKAAFYVNASSGNGVFVRYQHLTHVYLGHGDSDKPPSYNPTHAMYDKIFAAGPAAARRYGAHGVRIPPEKFQIVGRPQVEGVQPATGVISEVAQPVVLYAPTWRGHVEETMLYSLPVGEQLVSTLLKRGATVIFRPHPFSYSFADDAATITRIQALLAADAAQTGRAHLWGAAAETERGIFDCINASDAMVSDVSSVVSDYLFSGKPFAMISVPSGPAEFVEEYPVAKAAYVVRGDLADFDETLARMLGPDPMSGIRADIRVDYLGDFAAEDYASTFVAAVREAASTFGDSEGQEDEEVTDDESSISSTPSWARYQRLITGTGLGLLGTLLAVCALVSALWRGGDLVTAGCVVAALVLGIFGLLDVVRHRHRWPRLLNEGSATRGTLLVVAAVLASTSGQRSPAVIVALVLLAVALAAEPQIRFSWGRIGLEVQGLPQLGAEVAERVPRGWLPLVNGAAIVVVLLLLLTSAPGWLLLAVSLIAFVVMLDVLLRALTRAARAISAEDRLYDALVELAPEFAVYFASTIGAAYQLG
ncbi:MAG: CDP-glycerol glycerophosphotransferase family protein, partial [Propionibacteriaceae bacterium]